MIQLGRRLRRAAPPWAKTLARSARTITRRNGSPPRSEANRAFEALIDHRKEWLFEHLSEPSATYHYDIFTKESQKRLARRLGLSVARDYLMRVPLAEAIAFLGDTGLERFAIKPNSSSSSHGFHRIARVVDTFYDLKTGRGRSLRGLERFLRHDAIRYELTDEWVLEELLTPADESWLAIEDYKFYCFGGDVELILHKWPAPNPKGSQRNWYARDWSPVEVSVRGGNEGSTRAPVNGHRLVAAAEDVARRLCYPFIRIDLYTTTRGIVFGEFTPGPGRVRAFTERSSERYLQRWHEAESRLLERIRSGDLVPLVADGP